MHTSTRLRADDFHFWQQTASANQPVDFATFSPDYHEQDRVGVISLGLEDGVLQTSYALLALTTAFYDRLRARARMTSLITRNTLPLWEQKPIKEAMAK